MSVHAAPLLQAPGNRKDRPPRRPLIQSATADLASLARPGGNATGFVQFEYSLSGRNGRNCLKSIRAPRRTRGQSSYFFLYCRRHRAVGRHSGDIILPRNGDNLPTARPDRSGRHHALMEFSRGAAAQERLALDCCTPERLLREPGLSFVRIKPLSHGRMDTVSTD